MRRHYPYFYPLLRVLPFLYKMQNQSLSFFYKKVAILNCPHNAHNDRFEIPDNASALIIAGENNESNDASIPLTNTEFDPIINTAINRWMVSEHSNDIKDFDLTKSQEDSEIILDYLYENNPWLMKHFISDSRENNTNSSETSPSEISTVDKTSDDEGNTTKHPGKGKKK